MHKSLATLAVLSALAPFATVLHAADGAPVALDLLLRGGTVYTGDSDTPVVGDVGIAGDRIVFAGKAAPTQFTAKRVIDATGMVVAPGFIDAHTHADADLHSGDPKKRLNIPFITQGVTTAVIGNDGFGGFDIAAQAQKLRAAPVGTNVAMYVGFGPVRMSELGEANRAPTPEQLEAMKKRVSQGTYTQPALLSEGVSTVLVNGQLAVDGGKPTGVGAGQPLLRTPKAGSCG